MTKNIFKLIFFLMFVCGTISAQEKKGDLLFRAMQDEMGRSMKELSMPGMERPFFVEYVITEGKRLEVTATLGSSTSIFETPFSRNISVRVMVGDYHRTNMMNYEPRRFQNFNSTTIDDNYVQLKCELWRQTDMAYKNAAVEYSRKMALLKQKNLSPEESDLDDYIKSNPVDNVVSTKNIVIDKVRLNRLAEELSSIFKDYPDIDDSKVSASFNSSDFYVMNSENSKYSFQNNNLNITTNLTCRVDGKTLNDFMIISAIQEQDLPSLEEIKAQIKEFAERFISMKKAQTVKGYYSGPVLFEGSAVASLFEQELFSGKGAYATRESLQGFNEATLQEKMDSKVIANEYTVKCMPFLEEYGGKKLVGHFDMDFDGIVPEKELMLIENGILKHVIGGRIPSKYNNAPSGYFRKGLYLTALCPGVVDISTSRGVSKDTLKKLLIRAAGENGYKYAYILRQLNTQPGSLTNGPYPIYLYRINVVDGSEELVRDAEIRDLRQGILKLVLGSSNNKIVVNTNYFTIPVTYICPDAVLLPDIEIVLKKNTQKTPPYVVASPLKDKI